MIPKPPPGTGSSADFLVQVFVLVVASVLVLFTVAVIIGTFIGTDESSAAATIGDIVTTLIGSLFGFIAGKGVAESQARNGKTPPAQPSKENDA